MNHRALWPLLRVVRGLAIGLIPANPVTGYAQVGAAASQNQALAAETTPK